MQRVQKCEPAWIVRLEHLFIDMARFALIAWNGRFPLVGFDNLDVDRGVHRLEPASLAASLCRISFLTQPAGPHRRPLCSRRAGDPRTSKSHPFQPGSISFQANMIYHTTGIYI